jgi:dimethylargininase
MFTRAIVRIPGNSLTQGLTTVSLGQPDPDQARTQHQEYIRALEQCGLAVTVLPPDEEYPDSCFVEDPAVLTERCAIITRPGATTRRGEIDSIRQTLTLFYDDLPGIEAPGTLEGGDVMRVADHFYIGLSTRTNLAGAQQLIQILNAHGYSGETVPLKEMFHLKSGVVYLEDDVFVTAGEFQNHPAWKGRREIHVPPEEEYAANCIRVNDYVLVAAGFPRTRDQILQAGFQIIELDTSEFRKVDGGLSCLSLRF